MNKKFLFGVALALLPLSVFAAGNGDDIWSLWAYAFVIIANLTRLFWVLSIIVFLWGLVDFLRKSDAPAEQAKAKQLIVGSVIAFLLGVSFWAFVTYALNSFNVDRGSTIPTTTAREKNSQGSFFIY